jgi:predicted transcriptional regulator
MTSDYTDQIYLYLTEEPVTPSEVANKFKLSYKTAQKALLKLAAEKRDIAYKKSGRIYLFWKKSSKNSKD